MPIHAAQELIAKRGLTGRLFTLDAIKRHSANPLERLNKEVERRADVVAHTGPCSRLLPNETSIIRSIGAVLLEQNDKWRTRNRCMPIKAMAEFVPTDATPALSFPPKAA